jgi:hypothetical protein
MREILLSVEDSEHTKVMAFKRIYDHIIEEDGNFDEFMQLVISSGIDTMLRQIIPQDPETLWNTVLSTYRYDPAAFSQYVIGTLGKPEFKKELKEKINYIG